SSDQVLLGRRNRFCNPAEGNLYGGGELSMRSKRIGWILAIGSLLAVFATSPLLAGASSLAPGPMASPKVGPPTGDGPSAGTQPSVNGAVPTSTTGQPAPTKLPDLVVTATRLSQPVGQVGETVTVVHSQQIQDQKIQQTSDALREVPGVQVAQSGGPGTLTAVSI